MSSVNQQTVANDPRISSAARPYQAPLVSPADLPVDYSGFIAAICGVIGIIFKYKLGSWLAIIFCAQSLANMKNMESDLKHFSMAMIITQRSSSSPPYSLLRVTVSFQAQDAITWSKKTDAHAEDHCGTSGFWSGKTF